VNTARRRRDRPITCDSLASARPHRQAEPRLARYADRAIRGAQQPDVPSRNPWSELFPSAVCPAGGTPLDLSRSPIYQRKHLRWAILLCATVCDQSPEEARNQFGLDPATKRHRLTEIIPAGPAMKAAVSGGQGGRTSGKSGWYVNRCL
jgi:hypothetical protein